MLSERSHPFCFWFLRGRISTFSFNPWRRSFVVLPQAIDRLHFQGKDRRMGVPKFSRTGGTTCLPQTGKWARIPFVSEHYAVRKEIFALFMVFARMDFAFSILTWGAVRSSLYTGLFIFNSFRVRITACHYPRLSPSGEREGGFLYIPL